MSHLLEGISIGIIVGFIGGFFLARREFQKTASLVARYIIQGRKEEQKNAVH